MRDQSELGQLCELPSRNHHALVIGLLINSAQCLDRILNVASTVLSKSEHVMEIISSLEGMTNAESIQSHPPVFFDRELDASLQYLRMLARQAAQADLDMRKLLGVSPKSSKRYFWTSPAPGNSMAECRKQLQDASALFTNATVHVSVERQEITMIQDKMLEMSKAAEQHLILAEATIQAVAEFQLHTTKIIRDVEKALTR